MPKKHGLSEDHRRALVEGSCIDLEVVEERGYFSIERKQHAIDLGFKGVQARPGLAIPVFGLGGVQAGYQLRSDMSRETDDGLVKYETRKGARALPDIHPRRQPLLGQWTETLYITEGVKKGDAATSKDLTCIALTGGVHGFRHKGGVHNELKDLVTWRGPNDEARDVRIMFDSDITRKYGVYDAANRLADLVRAWGGKPSFIILPDSRDGSKQGIDDFFVAGGTVEQLEGLRYEILPEFTGKRDNKHVDPSAPIADQLVQMVANNSSIELFHAPSDPEHGYATVEKDGVFKTYDVDSGMFTTWLTGEFYRQTGKAPSKESLQNAIGAIRAEAVFNRPEHPIALRVAEHDGDWFIHLCDPKRRVVRIAGGRWELVSKCPVRFVENAAALPLPCPASGGNLKELARFCNVVDDGDQRLFICWTVAALIPRGPYPILDLYGEAGTAKSGSTKKLRMLIDPNEVDARRPPRSEEDLMVAAHNSHLVAYENMSGMPPWLSDAFCALSTGSGFSTRKFYTNKEESRIKACRPIILNGIPPLAVHTDFADRCIALRLPVIAKAQRVSEDELNAKFDAKRPEIFGALMDVLAKVQRELPSLKVKSLPRMADFARIGIAVEHACGWPEGSFLQAFERNSTELAMLAMDSSLGGVLFGLVEEQLDIGIGGVWTVGMKDLLGLLRARVSDDRDLRGYLPKSPRGLRAQLDRIAPSLRKAGVDMIHMERTNTGARVSFKRLARPEPAPASSSAAEHEQESAPGGSLQDAEKEEGNQEAEDEVSEVLTLADGPVHELLCDLLKMGISVDLVTHGEGLNVEDSHGKLSKELRALIDARQSEIIAHIRGSPGIDIIDYPVALMAETHEWQEYTIESRKRRRKVAECRVNGVPALKWYPDVSEDRKKEIARELGLV